MNDILDHESALLSAAQHYQTALEEGRSPDRQAFLAGYPHLADALPVYLDALATNQRRSREEGIDAALNAHDLDVLVAPTASPAFVIDEINGNRNLGGSSTPAALAGYPLLTMLAGYTPFAGRKLRGWPVTVLSRGRVIVDGDKCLADAGSGQFLARSGGEAAKPTGRLVADVDPERNFGAKLL